MILVTSANGNVGRKIIPILIKNGLDVKAMDINPDVENLKSIGVKDYYIGDGRSKDDVKEALKGCDKVLYIPPMFVYDETKIAQICIDEATDAGISKFVMMSVTHPNMSTLLQHTAKLKAEEHLIYKGLSHKLDYTILQPMHYNHNFNVKDVQEHNAYNIFYTTSTKLSYVHCEDVGEVAAKVLIEDNHSNATYELVGDDFLSPEDMVSIYNDITGEKAVANHVDVEDLIKMIGNPDSYFAETFRCLSDTYGKYGIAGNSNVLTWLLGRKPTSFKEYVEGELAK